MSYVDTGDNQTTNNSGTTTGTQKGTVIGNGLRIRSGAGTDYDVVGSLNKGDKVTITAQKTVGGTVWCNIGTGWISMDFVEID